MDIAQDLYGFWLYPGTTFTSAPIACKSYQPHFASVVADSIEDFLAILSTGVESMRDYLEGKTDWIETDFTAQPEFTQWLTTISNIALPVDGPALITKARAKHPVLKGDW